tara:strand:+ start:1808 stop:2110 length:303 start_codon:yes stop_codon:yes gene_type:complete
MSESIYFFSNKIENKYNVFINYDLCEIIINKINNNLIKLDKIKKNIEHKKKKLTNKQSNFKKQSIRTSDIYIVSRISDYENYLKKIIYDEKFKYEVLSEW